MPSPVIAIVTKARATYFKPLYEAFAQAQPQPWRTAMLWPQNFRNEHPDSLVVPRGDNFDIIPVQTGRLPWQSQPTGNVPSRDAWQKLRQYDPAALLIHEFPPFTVQALLYAKKHKTPVVLSTEVGKSNAHHYSATTRLWHSFWGRFVDGIAAFSPSGLDPLSGKAQPKVNTFHAIDSRTYLPFQHSKPSGEPLIFAYLGQLIHRKGLDLWLEAAALLHQQGFPAFKLRIIGSGNSSWLQGEIERTGMADHVELTGFLSGEGLRQALGTADVFVLPTRDDNYAAVVHEAACLALPLLVSKYAGASGPLVIEGVNGHVFDPYNRPAFAGTMGKLFDPAIRKRMGSASRTLGEAMSAHVRGRDLWHWFADHFIPPSLLNRAPTTSAHPQPISPS